MQPIMSDISVRVSRVSANSAQERREGERDRERVRDRERERGGGIAVLRGCWPFVEPSKTSEFPIFLLERQYDWGAGNCRGNLSNEVLFCLYKEADQWRGTPFALRPWDCRDKLMVSYNHPETLGW